MNINTQNDKEVEKLEKKLRKVYLQAQAETQAKMEDYLQRFAHSASACPFRHQPALGVLQSAYVAEDREAQRHAPESAYRGRGCG